MRRWSGRAEQRCSCPTSGAWPIGFGPSPIRSMSSPATCSASTWSPGICPARERPTGPGARRRCATSSCRRTIPTSSSSLTSGLAGDPAMREWLNAYVPGRAAELPAGARSTENSLWGRRRLVRHQEALGARSPEVRARTARTGRGALESPRRRPAGRSSAFMRRGRPNFRLPAPFRRRTLGRWLRPAPRSCRTGAALRRARPRVRKAGWLRRRRA